MKLYLMRLATFPAMGDAPVPGYLVQTDDGTNVLIDTGMPRQLIGAYGTSPDVFAKVEEQDHVVSQLASIGLVPDDIAHVIATHFDGDHAGNHDQFPAAEFVVQRAHYEAATVQGLERLQGTRSAWDAPGLRYRLVDGDTELLPGIHLIETSGHVPGHQAVLVRLPETGPVLLAIDAIPFASVLDPDTREITQFDMEEEGVRASTRKLADLASREGAMIVHGHDPQQWATLRTLPEYYS
jgi:N-acyl homoserine lactone hydrolase